ncbi:hypothetical protein BDY19DRAFT_901415 [Irpex rosettiformis]|uniref:Uncharacterized protein n=1 Tax=Irpex rosettiformis TaxID=378272 RepID=A0ACB8UIG8_9APHY|nr:hypothetical protein BDY19DRAFT_901415 [Irpex rosettiformis]
MPATGQRGLNYETDYSISSNLVTESRASTSTASISEVDSQVTAHLAQGTFFALNTICDPVLQVKCHETLFTQFSQGSSLMNNSCYHDSGANHHIFHDRAVFNNYREISHIPVKSFGSTQSTSAVSVGDIYFNASCSSVATELKLSNVLHVPSAHLNLVSQGCLECRGVSCHSANGIITLLMNGTSMVDNTLLPNNLYRLNMTPLPRSLAARCHERTIGSRTSED